MEYKFEYGACIPVRVHTIVMSAQHKATTSLEKIRADLIKYVINVSFFILFFSSLKANRNCPHYIVYVCMSACVCLHDLRLSTFIDYLQ